MEWVAFNLNCDYQLVILVRLHNLDCYIPFVVIVLLRLSDAHSLLHSKSKWIKSRSWPLSKLAWFSA